MDVDRVEKGKGKGKDFKGKGRGDKGKGLKGYKGYYQNGKGKPGIGKGFQFGGLGKGSQDKGKGKGKWTSDGGKKGKKGGFMKGPCFNCGRMGHRAAECREPQRVNQVEDDAASVSTRASSGTTRAPSTTAAPSTSTPAKVNRLELSTMPLIESFRMTTASLLLRLGSVVSLLRSLS